LYASIIEGFPRIAASKSPLWLTAITCQLSYPLNSENPSPLGTLTLYLSWPAENAALEASTAIDIATLVLISMLLHFIPQLLIALMNTRAADGVGRRREVNLHLFFPCTFWEKRTPTCVSKA
jgi:hypothetical protein